MSLYSYGSSNFRCAGNIQNKIIDHLELYKDVHIGEVSPDLEFQHVIKNRCHKQLYSLCKNSKRHDIYFYWRFSDVWCRMIHDDTCNSIISLIKKHNLVANIETWLQEYIRTYIDIYYMARRAIEKFRIIVSTMSEEDVNLPDFKNDLDTLTKQLDFCDVSFFHYIIFKEQITAFMLSGVLEKYRVQKYIHFDNSNTVLSDERNDSVYQSKSKHNFYIDIDVDNGADLMKSFLLENRYEEHKKFYF